MLRITVKYQQQQFNVESMGSRKIQEFMERLINQLKLPPGTIYGIFMQDAKLDNNKSFIENRVQSGQVLELKPVKQTNFGFVKVMYNNTPNFMHTDLDEQCDKLYNEVAAKISKQNNTFTLEFNGRMLEKQRPLKDYGIVSNSIINVIAQNYSGQQANPNAQTTVVIYYSNQYFTLPVPGQTLVSQIEYTIKNKFNLTQDVCLTTVNGLQLQSGQTIGSYNLPVNTQLTVSIKQQQQNQYNQPNAPIQQQYISAPIQQQQQNQQSQQYNQQSAPIQYNQPSGSIPSAQYQQAQQPPAYSQAQQGVPKEILILIEYQGGVQNIQVESNTLISDLEEAMQQQIGITQPVQLLNGGIPLPSNQTLAQLKISQGSRLSMQIKSQQSVPQTSYQPQQSSSEQPLQIYTPPQQLVHYGPPRKLIILLEYQSQVSNSEVQGDIRVSELEEAMQEANGITTPVQLIFENRVLPSNQTLDQLGIQKGSRIIVQIKPQSVQTQNQQITSQPINQISQQQPQQPQQYYRPPDNQIHRGPPRRLILIIDYQGTPTNIEIESNTMVSELEVAMQESQGLTQPIQFIFEGCILPSNQNLDQLGLAKGSRLSIQIKQQQQPQIQQQQQQIQVQIEYGTLQIDAELPTNNTILELEQSFEQELQIYEPVSLFYNGQQLNSNQTLQQIGIQQGGKLLVQKKSQLQKTQSQNQPTPQLPPKLILLLDYNNQTFNVELPRETQISEIEDSMRQSLGLTEQIQIVQDQEILDSNKTLQQLNIQKGTKLKIQPKQQTPQQWLPQPQKQGRKIILLIEHNGQVHNVEVDDTIMVSELEKNFSESLSLTGKISFIFNGKTLNSNTSFQEQNVIKGSRLQIQTTNIIAPPQQFIPNVQKPPSQSVPFQNSQFAQPLPPFQQQQIPFQNPQPPQALQQPSELALKIEINGQVLELALESTTLVQELEQLLKESNGITQPAGIYFQGQQLQSNMSFLQQRVPNGSKLEFKLLQIQQQSQPPQAPQAPPQSISLRISSEGAIIAIEIDLTTQIQELQDSLQEQLNLPQKCSLSFANQVIPPQMTIQQLNLKPNDILYLTQQIQQTQQPSNDIELIVSVQGEDLVMEVPADSMVFELMDIIKQEKTLYMPTELLCEGRVLVPSQSFRQQNVVSGTYLIMRNKMMNSQMRIKTNK